MRVADLSSDLVRAASVVGGVLFGLSAGILADVLPPRYGIRHLTRGKKRALRNAVLVAISGLCALGLAGVVLDHADVDVERASFYLATNVVLVSLLLGGAAVDLEHMILPNEITIGGAVVALLTAHFRSVSLFGSILGAIAGLCITYVPFLLYKWFRGHSGMGLGDAKLAITAGAWLGVEGAFFVLFVGALQSTLCAVLMRVLGIRYAVPESVRAEIDALRERAAAGDEEAKAELADDPMAAQNADSLRTTTLPLGPFLVLAAIEFVFFGRPIVDAFLRLGS